MKFRIWDNCSKEWTNDMLLKQDGTFCCDIPCLFISANFIVCHCTGLTDINGKEIYQGDVVKYKGNQTGTVEFGRYNDDEGYSTERHLGWLIRGQSIYNILDRNDTVVIGNIYENPELLKRS